MCIRAADAGFLLPTGNVASYVVVGSGVQSLCGISASLSISVIVI